MRRFLLILVYTLISLNLFADQSAQIITIGKISFEGNNFFSADQLNKIITVEPGEVFSMEELTNSAQKISAHYQSFGYLNVLVIQPEILTDSSQLISVRFNIVENGSWIVDKIEFMGNRNIVSSKFPLFIKQKISKLPKYLKSLVDFYNRQGFLFASAKIDTFSLNEENLQVTILIEEGDFCNFEKIRVKGNNISQVKSIIRISGLEEKEILTQKDFSSARVKLSSKAYIKNASVLPLNSKEILIDIVEDRMTIFSGILGYDDASKEKFTGFFNLDFLNLLGTDRALNFQWQKLTSSNETLQLAYHESGFYRIPINGDFMLYREEADSTYIRSSAEIELFYYSGNNRFGLSYGLENIVPGSRQDDLTITKREYSKIGFSWLYNSLDNSSNPTKGISSKIKYYNIKQKAEEDIFRSAVVTKFSGVLGIKKRVVLYSNSQINLLEKKSLGEMDYWKLGGFDSVRGFMEDQYYGYYTAHQNLELRLLLSAQSRIYIFSDYGYAQNEQYIADRLFGFGLGIRLETNLGVVGIDYGFGKGQDEWRSPLNGIIHFGIETKL